MSAADALAALRKADPDGAYDYDHLYDPSGAASAGGVPDATAHGEVKAIRIGMIDGGIDARHRAFRTATLMTKNVASSKPAPPTVHGTAIASLLVGEDDNFRGYLPGATLYAVDVYGGDPSGGSAVDIVRALDWLATNRVAVANVSLAGPPNALLEAGVKAFLARGHVLVAAIGNEGPAAPRQYPANYPGVIAVTSVDADKHAQLDTSSGAASFAALGVDVRAAALHGYGDYTGTSFAAPAVAAHFALLMPAPDPQAAKLALARLEHAALPLGKDAPGYLGAPTLALAGK
jgi:subtilisin family serine protease